MDSFSFTEKELEECAVVPSFKKAKVLQLLSDIPRLCLDKVKGYLAEWRRLLSLSAHTDLMQPGGSCFAVLDVFPKWSWMTFAFG